MLTLVIGGSASGKSAYAESLCLQSPLPRTYLATMQVWDDECAARVARHRAMRAQKQFDTVECPLHAASFCLKTGKALCLPATDPLTTYPVHVEGGDIFIDLPEAQP